MISKVDLETCIDCGICEKVCPVDVIYMDPKTKKPILKYIDHCITCFNCEIDCPVGAIDVHPIVKLRPYSW